MSGAPEKHAQRLGVAKTYKFYVGGAFIRPESGRTYPVTSTIDSADAHHVNAPRASRKDLREAIRTAAGAWKGWSERTATNRGQILYRIAEMLEARRGELHAQLVRAGATAAAAEAEVAAAIDLWIHYAGWCDKYQALFSSVNPTNTSHFNFSVYEPTGVVGIMAGGSSGLLELVGLIAPVIAGGNTCVVVASEKHPLPAVTFTEVLATSDLPGGVVNLMTGFRSELLKPLVAHMDVNAVVVASASKEERTMLDTEATCNLKRVVYPKSDQASPYAILDTQEVKTTWHPIERGQGGSGGY